jgi:hypothetical protein
MIEVHGTAIITTKITTTIQITIIVNTIFGMINKVETVGITIREVITITTPLQKKAQAQDPSLQE